MDEQEFIDSKVVAESPDVKMHQSNKSGRFYYQYKQSGLIFGAFLNFNVMLHHYHNNPINRTIIPMQVDVPNNIIYVDFKSKKRIA